MNDLNPVKRNVGKNKYFKVGIFTEKMHIRHSLGNLRSWCLGAAAEQFGLTRYFILKTWETYIRNKHRLVET